jgi:molybdopterin-guanine dinucleotide biosynthesis protein A
MGEDKAFLVIGGTPLVARAISRLRPQVAQLILNVHRGRRDFGAYQLPVVEDPTADHQGPLVGLLASLRWAETKGIPWIATAAVDTPFFPKDLVVRLEAAARNRSMAAARSGGRLHPVFGLWRSELASPLEREIGNGLRSLDRWLARHDAGIADWPTEPYDPFFNINRPEDLPKASQILDEHAP